MLSETEQSLSEDDKDVRCSVTTHVESLQLVRSERNAFHVVYCLLELTRKIWTFISKKSLAILQL